MALREDCARQVSRNTRGRDRRNACDHQGWHSPLQLSGRSRRRAQKQPRALLRHHETTERRYCDEQGACNQVRAARRADARGISSPLTDCFALDPPLPCQTGKTSKLEIEEGLGNVNSRADYRRNGAALDSVADYWGVRGRGTGRPGNKEAYRWRDGAAEYAIRHRPAVALSYGWSGRG